MENCNWYAMIAATLMPTLVGIVYYHPKVVGGAWMKANGFTLESVGDGPKPILYGVSMVLSFMLAMWMCFNVTGPGQEVAEDGHSYVTFQHGMFHGLINTVMLVLPILGMMAIFEKRGLNWVLIAAAYWLITLMMMGGILSMWR